MFRMTVQGEQCRVIHFWSRLLLLFFKFGVIASNHLPRIVTKDQYIEKTKREICRTSECYSSLSC
ncbi:hypothetical protein BDQ12DRAFT_682917 [Crucibulum laeve]|uniref:Uncharacterized protein n=1 Tax=Crucibulum laeve TaxID=68775 RepID=A0A5C3M1N0_9AGAR|nr:hypothetical protein BDQ12DRAFT_682917 [Crucibulum laeve]